MNREAERVMANACPDCGADMQLRETRKFTTRDGQPKKFYGCVRWPACNGVHGAHPDGRPLGVPADKATKQARIRAHAAFDLIWQNNRRVSRKRARGAAYAWLQRAMGIDRIPHIGEMDVEQCEEVIRLCAERDVLPRRYDAWESLSLEVASC